MTGGHEYKMAMVVYDALLPFAFIFASCGLAYSFFAHQDDIKNMTFGIATAAFCCALLAGYPSMVINGQKSFEELGKTIESEIDTFKTAWGKPIPEVEEGTWLEDLKNGLSVVILNCLQALGFVGYWILKWIQPYALSVMIAFAPLTICMFQIPATKSIAIKTWMTTFGVLLWPIGTAVADIFIAKIGTVVLTAAGVALGVAVVAPALAPAILAKMLGAFLLLAIFINLLYLTVPISIGMILSGGSGAFGAVGSAAFMAASVAPLANSMGKLAESLKGLLGKLGGGGGSPTGGGSTDSSDSGDWNFGSSSSAKGLPAPSSSTGKVTRMPRAGGPPSPLSGGGSGGSLGMGPEVPSSSLDPEIMDQRGFASGGIPRFEPRALPSPSEMASRRRDVMKQLGGGTPELQ